MPATIRIQQSTLSAKAEGQERRPIGSRMGIKVTEDWYLHMVLAGYAYQVKVGTLTTPVVGDVAITVNAAEYCVDAASGLTIVPVYHNISVRAGTGTAHEMAIKSHAVVSSGGVAFVPLLLNTGGIAVPSTLTARVDPAGAVTVSTESATATPRHWSYSQQAVFTTGQVIIPDWIPRMPPVLQGPTCLYAQVAAATAGPSYYANLDFVAVGTAVII